MCEWWLHVLLKSLIAPLPCDSVTYPIWCFRDLFLCQSVSTVLDVYMAGSCVVEVHDCYTSSISRYPNLWFIYQDVSAVLDTWMATSSVIEVKIELLSCDCFTNPISWYHNICPWTESKYRRRCVDGCFMCCRSGWLLLLMTDSLIQNCFPYSVSFRL